MSKIPKAKKSIPISTAVPKPKLNITESAISFSFEALEVNEYFNLDATCINWSVELFTMLHNISSVKKTELISGYYANSTYRVHTHENAKPPVPLPNGVALKDFYQIRISKSKGGIHGVFYGDVFYVIWLDPLHNMYPDDKFGGLRKIKAGSNCCKDREEIINQLTDENIRLKKENAEWEELINNSEN